LARKRKRLEVLRRLLETVSVLSVGCTVLLQREARTVARIWDTGMPTTHDVPALLGCYLTRKLMCLELVTFCTLVIGLYGLFPLRISRPAFRLSGWWKAACFLFSPDFDPAPLIYPVLLPALIVMSLGHNCCHLLLPNLILGLCSLPSPVVPCYCRRSGVSAVHWAITVVPILISRYWGIGLDSEQAGFGLDGELLVLLLPLQQTLVSTLRFLTTTSLLPTEVQLLATGLINLLLFSASPQSEILKALLWLGGTCLLVTCRHVLAWEVTLARVPSWKFRRSMDITSNAPKDLLRTLDQRLCQKLSSGLTDHPVSDSDDVANVCAEQTKNKRSHTFSVVERHLPEDLKSRLRKSDTGDFPARTTCNKSALKDGRLQSRTDRFATPKTTSRGRRKRVIGPHLRSFVSLTLAQAKVRKWAYAIYVYAAVILIILGPVRNYIGTNALRGKEPFGWALGYLFGNVRSFRLWLVMNNWNGWVCLPPWPEASSCHLGWVEHLRRDWFGEANTRLIISGYFLLVLTVGLTLVVRLSSSVQVDTRRKVFHGIMAAMLLPATYIDPAFSALALALILVIFLLLDLFRASQLPPISKPLTSFLSAYVDGRDHCGPVIVSHIFLLIGCAIPLWLSLAGARRTGTPPWEGWEVQGRDLSMVSGVVCVGLGDAAASLVGRRYGRHKWFWGGEKSIEGSLAFAAAVMVGLLVGKTWLVLGGWEAETPVGVSLVSLSLSSLVDPAVMSGWARTVGKTVLAAAGSSFTEAVLTGGNDNVVAPLVLWLLVRGLNV
jgi:dolichol kinase